MPQSRCPKWLQNINRSKGTLTLSCTVVNRPRFSRDMCSLAAVQIENVEHTCGDRRALDCLTLSIEASEIFAFLGPNGGGKTTLFRLLSTLIPIQRGEIEIFGHSV